VARPVDEQRRILTEIKGLLGTGKTEGEQLEALAEWNVGTTELRRLREEVLSEHIQSLRAETPEQAFVRHALRQEKHVDQLDEVVEACFSVEKVNGSLMGAAVSAIKAKASILDRLMERGQTLGVVHKAPSTSYKIGGMVVAHASINDLRKLVADKMRSLEALARQQAPVDYLAEPDGQLYFDVVPEQVVEQQPQPPKRQKVVV